VWARRKVKVEVAQISVVWGLERVHDCGKGKKVPSMKLLSWPLRFIGMLNEVGTMLTNLRDAKGAFGFVEKLLDSTESAVTLLLDAGCDEITDAK